MINRLQNLTDPQLDALHQFCMKILSRIGIVFQSDQALAIFQAHGFKIEGQKVFFSEKQVMTALETVPAQFTILARNPENSITIGGENFAFGPGWGAPFIIDARGNRRAAFLEDQSNFCKLIQTSDYLDLAAGSMAVPTDMSPRAASAALLSACLTLTDKPLVANPCSPENGREMAEMAAIAFGGRAALEKGPVSIVSINPLSPLTFTEEAAGGLISFAQSGQALLISSMILAGISGPLDIGGTAALEMSESLAGIVLAQLIRPGAPCVCGGTSCAADLRTGGVSLAGPEMIQLMAISSQMAARYGIPCRYGGNLTDSFSINIQAGMESALSLVGGLISGVHFIHQACGILGAYSAISFEKFVLDEELCGLMRRALEPVEISEQSIDLDLIERVGHGGNFMMTPETAGRCRTTFFPAKLAQRSPYEDWRARDLGNSVLLAAEQVAARLAAYEKPDIDPAIERDLKKYVALKGSN